MSNVMKKTETMLAVVLAAWGVVGGVQASEGRIDKILADDWRFVREDLGVSASTGAWTTVRIPHTWNNLDIMPIPSLGKETPHPGWPYSGRCWYAKRLSLDPAWRNQRLFVRFEAASLVANVYLNGTLLGEHRGGFTAFCFEITSLVDWSKENELRVSVDNKRSRHKDVAPLSGDFNLQGGIYRPVHLIVTDKACISPLDYASSGVYITQGNVSPQKAEMSVRTQLSGITAGSDIEVLTEVLAADGSVAVRVRSPLAGDASESVAQLTVPNPRLWQAAKDPYLYTCQVSLKRGDKVLDRVESTFGIRTVKITEKDGFLLNGQPYPIYGVNRHQDVKGKGWAVEIEDDARDISLITEMGATAIRLTHYPQSARVHDLCDRAGLLVWDEVPLVEGSTDSPAFTANVKLQMRELVLQLYNHPSVAFWGLQNEIRKDYERNAILLKGLKDVVTSLDQSRLIVAATCVGANPMDHVPDWNCWNKYPGWYYGGLLGKIAEDCYKIVNHRVGIGEYGAGGNAFHHTENESDKVKPEAVFHPEEYQSYLHEKSWASIRGSEKVWGTFLWNMFDFTVAQRNEGGFRGLNDKGLLTYDRLIKKDAFFFYKANWNPEPMLHVCSQRFVKRLADTVMVKAYANCGPVSLTVNGKSFGEGKPNAVNTIRWEKIPLDIGTNQVIVTATVGDRKLTSHALWSWDPANTNAITASVESK